MRDGGTAPRPHVSARALYDMRRWRDANAPGDYFGEPAWDLLLELQIAREKGAGTRREALIGGVGDPDGRRAALERLIADGLVEAEPDGDGFVLAARGEEFMDLLLGAAGAERD